mmetsp:Transcript_107098/g.335698  ORF Transcript_107098/g.335698 Transcript_107098/m.335698 type:complete len:547 (-) Transcript_107098:41-1681(-)
MATDGGGGGTVNAALLRASLSKLLEEHRAEAATWLERHNDELRLAIERALPGAAAAVAADPVAAPGPAASGVMAEVGVGTFVAVREAGAGGGEDNAAAPDAGAFLSKYRGHHLRDRSLFMAQLTGDQESEKVLPASFQERVRRVVSGSYFETTTGILISSYTVILFVQLQFSGTRMDASLGLGDNMDTHIADTVFDVSTHVFTWIFVLELLIKLFALRTRFFSSAFNVFDMVCVVATTADVYLMSLIRQTSATNVFFLRVMRILRLARILRFVRTMETFQKLRVLTQTIIISFMSIFWSMFTLFIFMVVGALLMTQLLQDCIVDRSYDDDVRIWMSRYYGTSLSSLYTMFEMTFSGCWPSYARRLIEEVSPWFSAFFVVYVILVIFTLIRIIYALLIKDTMQAATDDAEQVVRERSQQTNSLVAQLSQLFIAADTSGDGFLSRDEFEEIMSYPKVRTWMSALGMAVQDSEALFMVLADGAASESKISYEEFVQGVMRLKGHARGQDLLCNMRDTRRILKQCESMRLDLARLQRQQEQESAQGTFEL